MTKTVSIRIDESLINAIKELSKGSFNAEISAMLEEHVELLKWSSVEVKRIFTEVDLESMTTPAFSMRFTNTAFHTTDEVTNGKVDELSPLQVWALYNVLRNRK